KAILKRNGIEVIDNILPEKGQSLIKEFYEFHTNKRPFVYVKAAMSLDGFISPNSSGLNYISKPKTLRLVHVLRTCVQAICVGVNTINVDQPRLSVRLDDRLTDFQPTIVIIDPHQKLDYDWVLNALNQGRKIIVFSKTKAVFESQNFYFYPTLTDDKSKNWSIVLATLYDHNIQSVLVEGGASIFHSILNAGAFN
ncbi:MAG: dihydrofolate reductase family protein, partial [Candidatus Margulisiibacteriota bacterium]|nr:dihydrofolate reductase family protein [Candidatus Margulisiibacteriota bacterium]